MAHLKKHFDLNKAKYGMRDVEMVPRRTSRRFRTMIWTGFQAQKVQISVISTVSPESLVMFGLVLKVWSCFKRVSCSLRGFCGQRFPRRRLGNPCLAKSRHHQETQAERPVAAAAVPSLSATGHARCVALLATVDLSARKTEDRGWSRKWW